MATTTNYSWTTPDDTDLVKDGAAAIRTLGSSADTTVKNLNPGTTAGDIDYYTSGTAKARIGIGTAGQVLTVNSGATAPEWAAAPAGKIKQIIVAELDTQAVSSSSTYADSGLTATITPTSASSTILIISSCAIGKDSNNTGVSLRLLRGATTIKEFAKRSAGNGGATENWVGTFSHSYIDSPATTSATTYKVQFASYNNSANAYMSGDFGGVREKSTILLMEIGA